MISIDSTHIDAWRLAVHDVIGKPDLGCYCHVLRCCLLFGCSNRLFPLHWIWTKQRKQPHGQFENDKITFSTLFLFHYSWEGWLHFERLNEHAMVTKKIYYSSYDMIQCNWRWAPPFFFFVLTSTNFPILATNLLCSNVAWNLFPQSMICAHNRKVHKSFVANMVAVSR